jgi:hypothetical protein
MKQALTLLDDGRVVSLQEAAPDAAISVICLEMAE